MTKGEIIDIILLRVNGGVLSSDSKVRREDVSAMLSPAISAVLKQEERIRKRESIISMRALGYTSMDTRNDLYTRVVLKLEKDEDEELYKANLPYTPSSVSGVAMIKNVKPKSSKQLDMFAPAQDEASLIGLEQLDQVFYWYEKVNGKPLIYLYNVGLPACNELTAQMVIDISSLSDDEEVLVPRGLEIDMLILLVEWFTGERMQPGEFAINGIDDFEQNRK